MKIIRIREATKLQKDQAAEVLIEAFRYMPTAVLDFASARREIDHLMEPRRTGFLAIENGAVYGIIGAIMDSRFLWELDPLAVHPDHQRRGIGTRLVRTLEEEAMRQGVVTTWLGTDDDFGGTNIFGVDLYPNVLEHLMNLQPVKGHPYMFYQKMGYTVVGVIPDSDGLGKHDIIMAKRIG